MSGPQILAPAISSYSGVQRSSANHGGLHSTGRRGVRRRGIEANVSFPLFSGVQRGNEGRRRLRLRDQDNTTDALRVGSIRLGGLEGVRVPEIESDTIGFIGDIVGLAGIADGQANEALVRQGETVLLDLVSEPAYGEDIRTCLRANEIFAVGGVLQVVVKGDPGGTFAVGVDECVVLAHS